MKSILMSIQPKWCELIVSGEDYLDEKSGCVLFDYECISKYHKPIERPPQSWQYIQELEEYDENN